MFFFSRTHAVSYAAAEAFKGRATALLALLAVACIGMPPCSAHDGHKHAVIAANGTMPATVQRSWLTIPATDLRLTDTDGIMHELSQELEHDGPIYLNFIYTSCTTVCPLMSQIFVELQPLLSHASKKPRLISISIDPEHDTVARLTEHARAVGAGPDWHFLTGTVQASESVQRLFGVYTQDKMNHQVATFYRASKGARWLRLDGFLTPEQLLKETRVVKAPR